MASAHHQGSSSTDTFAAKSRQVVDAAASYFSRLMPSFADKENAAPANSVGVPHQRSLTPGKRKADNENGPRTAKRSPTQVPTVASSLGSLELSPTNSDGSDNGESFLELVGRESPVSSTVSSIPLLEQQFSALIVRGQETVQFMQPPSTNSQHKLRRETLFSLEIPPPTPSDGGFPSASSINSDWGMPYRMNPEGVYPTPSPTTSLRTFFAPGREWVYDIPGSVVDGEPSVQDLDEVEDPDPLCVREYAEEIHRYLKTLETKTRVKRNYFERHRLLNWQMRCDLVDWLIDLCTHLRYHTETLHHSCVLLDIYLSMTEYEITPEDFQLVGSACFLLASKVEEIEPPTLTWLASSADGAFDRNRLRSAEIHVLSTLGWNAGGFTNATHFLARASRAEALGLTKQLTQYIVELAIFERRLLGENPSLICAAAVWMARKIAGKKECWTPSLEYHLDHSPAEIPFQHCVRILFNRIREGSPSQALLLRHPGTWIAAERWASVIPAAELERMLRFSAAKFATEPLSPTVMVSASSRAQFGMQSPISPPTHLRRDLSRNRMF